MPLQQTIESLLSSGLQIQRRDGLLVVTLPEPDDDETDEAGELVLDLSDSQLSPHELRRRQEQE
jgi:hypothetical protein